MFSFFLALHLDRLQNLALSILDLDLHAEVSLYNSCKEPQYDSWWLPRRRPWWWVGWRSWWSGRGIGSLPDAQGRCDDGHQFKYSGVNVVVRIVWTPRQNFLSRLIDYSGCTRFPTHVIMKKYIKIMKATCGHPWWDKRGSHPCSLGDLLLRGSRSLSSKIIWRMRNM